MMLALQRSVIVPEAVAFRSLASQIILWLNSLVAGFALATMALAIEQWAKGLNAFPRQPGHWLLFSAGTSNGAQFVLAAVPMILSFKSPAWDSFVVVVMILIRAIVLGYGAAATKQERSRWRTLLRCGQICCVTLGLVFGLLLALLVIQQYRFQNVGLDNQDDVEAMLSYNRSVGMVQLVGGIVGLFGVLGYLMFILGALVQAALDRKRTRDILHYAGVGLLVLEVLIPIAAMIMQFVEDGFLQ